ncbi:unnamed protein product, partial [Onchocerca ochengi]
LIVTAWVHHDQYAVTGMKGPHEQSIHNAKMLELTKISTILIFCGHNKYVGSINLLLFIFRLHTIFLSIESALFGLFVLAVSCDQIQAILNDETAVEAAQRKGFHNRVTQSRSKITLIREVCGNGPMILWLLPCSTLPSEQNVIQLSNQSLIV